MSTTHTRVTIGTKPMDAIVAEFAAAIGVKPEARPPDDRPGWIEAGLLMRKLGLNKGRFKRHMDRLRKQGRAIAGFGTRLDKSGKLSGTRYHMLIAPHPAQIAPKETKRARGGA